MPDLAQSAPSRPESPGRLHDHTSATSTFTSRRAKLITCGESSGKSKIVIPFTTRVAHGTVNPRRTRSDTALPSATDLRAAYCFTTGTMSSSSEIVVRMLNEINNLMLILDEAHQS